MRLISPWPAVLGLALAMVLIMALQIAGVVDPVLHSLSYASAAIVLIAMVGWVLEARAVAGPPPAEEPEHEEEEHAPGPSYWPIVLALGVVGIAAGLVYDWEYGAFLVAVPMALAAAGFWADALSREAAEGPARLPWYVPPAPAVQAAAARAGGGVLAPVAPRVLAAQAAGGAAIAIERVAPRAVSRRGLLRLTFWTGLGAGLATLAATTVDLLYPRGISGFGSVISAGTVDEFPPGRKKEFPEGKFWLVHLTEEQGGPGFLALWWKCPHLGCTVPWRENFSFVNPNTNQETRGWFRCPCHGSTYDHAGVRVFGPAPRSLDVMELTIDPATKRISVNTGRITKGVPDNARFAKRAP